MSQYQKENKWKIEEKWKKFTIKVKENRIIEILILCHVNNKLNSILI